MIKLIVYLHGMDGFVNIAADRIERDDVFLTAYKGDSLVGMFDVGTIMAVYLSEKNQEKDLRDAREYNKNGIERR